MVKRYLFSLIVNKSIAVVASTHIGSKAGLKKGVYYINGYFIEVDDKL